MSKPVTMYQIKSQNPGVADWLCEHYPGSQLYIPKKQSSVNYESDQKKYEYIYNLCTNAGVSQEQVADDLGLTKDRVQKIVSMVHYQKHSKE